jgi:hypothetical protein
MAALKEWGYSLAPVEELVIDPTADHLTELAAHSASNDDAHDTASAAESVCVDRATENVEDETG